MILPSTSASRLLPRHIPLKVEHHDVFALEEPAVSFDQGYPAFVWPEDYAHSDCAEPVFVLTDIIADPMIALLNRADRVDAYDFVQVLKSARIAGTSYSADQ